jgi:putative DNA primase/helicase
LLELLGSIWPDDTESIDTLQEFFGYSLTQDTRQQKILLILGPKRSGKGTIARLLNKVVGQHNVCGPTLSSLENDFGLAPLIGKTLAIISDARLGSKANQHAIAERLLAISGEDMLSIPRKYLVDYTAKLSVRFLIMANMMPRLADTSGALASRFIVLKMTRSFYGEEDLELDTKLAADLPGTLNWAIEGWLRLKERGYFAQPASAEEEIVELEDLGSPVSAFLREKCIIQPHAEVECEELYLAWCNWCGTQGRDYPGTLQTFGRDIRAAVPGVKTKQPRPQKGKVQRKRRYVGIGLLKALGPKKRMKY